MRSEEISVAPRQAAPVLLLTDAELAAISGGIAVSSPAREGGE